MKRCEACGARLVDRPARCPLCGTDTGAVEPKKKKDDAGSVSDYQAKMRKLRAELNRLKNDEAEAV